MKKIDARGLDCPAPVLHTKDIIEKENPDALEVIVDTEAARQNVCRFLESLQFETEARQEGNAFYITGKRSGCAIPEKAVEKRSESGLKKIMVIAATDRIGFGDDELGLKLMVNFIKTLKEMGPELWRLVFVNNGVKLAVEGSTVLPELKELENNAIQILVCGTCLNHFNLLEKKKAGETTNMLDIVTAMQLADKVINI